jgi:hypothetical protein
MSRRTSKVGGGIPTPKIILINIDSDKTCVSVENGTNKPKASVPLKKIVTVNEFSEEDQKKYKKLAKANDLGIKLVFKKRYLVEKAYVPDDDNELDMSDGEAGSGEDANEEEEKGRTASKSRGATPGNAANAKKAAASKAAELETWYLVCDNK